MLLKIYYDAALNATKDRITITKGAKKQLTGTDLRYYNKLKSISGPSVHKPNRIVKSWIRAYNHQIEREKWIARLQQPFKTPSIARKIIGSIFH